MTTIKTKAKKVAGTTAKKSPARATKSKKALPRAEGPQCFWVTDGQVLADLLELHRSLEQMSEEVFEHHVNTEKNDFADWVEFVLEDTELAQALRKSKRPETACTVVSRRLKIYSI